jgi:hypothetical protein
VGEEGKEWHEKVKEMALKRPEEKHWNWRTPKEPYPKTPGCGILLAPSGQGKSSQICALILGPYAHAKIFDELHIYSPSVDVDSLWDPVREHAKGLKASSFNRDWDEKGLLEIIDRQMAKIKELKAAKSKKPLPQLLVVVDDHADNPHIMHNASNILTTLFVRGRHGGISCWISSQKLSACSQIMRVNTRFMCIWRLRNRKELVDGVLYELSALFPVSVLNQMYETAIQDEDFSFWYINLIAKKKEDMMFIRFEHKMVLDTNDGADPARLEGGELDTGRASADLDAFG